MENQESSSYKPHIKQLPSAKQTLAQLSKPYSELIWVDKNDSIETAWGLLRQHGYRSVAVLDKENNKSFLGLLTLRDLTLYAVRTWNNSDPYEEKSVKNERFLKTPVSAVSGLAASDYIMAKEDDLVSSVVGPLSRGFHFVVIKGTDGQIKTIASNHRIFSSIFKNYHFGDTLKQKPVKSVQSVVKDVGAVLTTFTVAQSLNLLATYRVSCLGIVNRDTDGNDKLVDAWSESDIMFLGNSTTFDLNKLVQNIGQAKQGPGIRRRTPSGKLVYVTPETPIFDALELLDILPIHRLFILDPSKDARLGLVGVLSLTDAFQIIHDMIS